MSLSVVEGLRSLFTSQVGLVGHTSLSLNWVLGRKVNVRLGTPHILSFSVVEGLTSLFTSQVGLVGHTSLSLDWVLGRRVIDSLGTPHILSLSVVESLSVAGLNLRSLSLFTSQVGLVGHTSLSLDWVLGRRVIDSLGTLGMSSLDGVEWSTDPLTGGVDGLLNLALRKTLMRRLMYVLLL